MVKVSCITSPGRPTNIDLQLGKACILVAGKGGEIFISSVSSLSFLFLFLPCPSLTSTLLHVSLVPHFSLSLGDDKE